MMRIRLRFLLTSFNKSAMDYALARLEVALANPHAPAPPLVDRVGVQLRPDDDFDVRWPAAVAQVSSAVAYVADANRGTIAVKRDLAWARLSRTVKMIRQFADSIECFAHERGEGRIGGGGA